jgi:hypothetical protein
MGEFKLKRGFTPLRKVMSDKGKFVASCDSCKFFFREDGEEEYCHNPNVTKFDMQEVGNRIFCTFWSVLDKKEEY